LPAERPRTRVSLVRCPDYDPQRVRRAVKQLVDALGGMGAFVRPGDRVLLKPNLIVPRPAEAAVTTHPEVVRAVALEVLAAGGRPFVGDSPAFSSALSAARASGIEKVAKEIGMEVADLGRRPRSRQIDALGHFQRASFGARALEADAIINLPKIKAHGQTAMSLGVKNMFGAVAGKRKAFFHFRNGDDPARFGRLLVAVCRHLAPALTISDAVVALERSGPTRGDPRRVGLLAASADPVAVDRVILEVLGVDPGAVPYIRAASDLGYGAGSLAEIDVVGEAIETVRVPDYIGVSSPTPISFSLARVIRSIARQAAYLARAKIQSR